MSMQEASQPDHAPGPERASPIPSQQLNSAGTTVTTWPEFVSLVARMRAAQAEYFHTRTRGALIASKQLEHQVDDIIAHGLDSSQAENDPSRQLDLFPGQDGPG